MRQKIGTKAYYTLIRVPISFDSKEYLTLGLLYVEDCKVRFKYSHRKLDAIRSLISNEQYMLLKLRIRGLDKAAKKSSIGIPELSLVEEFSFGYLEYLSRYSNNIMIFDKPVVLEAPIVEFFDVIYQKFVDAHDNKEKKRPLEKIVKSKFSTSSKKKLSWDVSIDQKLISNLPVVKFKVHFAGRHSGIIVGETLDFHKSIHTLVNRIATLELLSRTASDKALDNVFVIGNKPKKSAKDHYKQWEFVQKSNYLEYLSYKDVDQLNSYIEQNDIIPLVQQ